jgi:predicted TIM-barrel fold metal-dependent hydrolase
LRPDYTGGEFQSVSSRIDDDAVKDGDAPTISSFVVYATNLMWSSVDLVFSGQLQKHPKLKFMLAEGGIGWFPYLMERMDSMWERHRYYQPIDARTRPSDLFKRHFWGCFINDDSGIRVRNEMAIDRICVEIDYPHVDCNWPNSRKILTESLQDVPDEDAHKIVELNARFALNFPRS